MTQPMIQSPYQPAANDEDIDTLEELVEKVEEIRRILREMIEENE